MMLSIFCERFLKQITLIFHTPEAKKKIKVDAISIIIPMLIVLYVKTGFGLIS